MASPVLPPILLSIEWCESHDDPTAVNASSGDGGSFQFSPATWADYGGYSLAQDAPVAVQDAGALALYQRRGTEPWKSSETCWG